MTMFSSFVGTILNPHFIQFWYTKATLLMYSIAYISNHITHNYIIVYTIIADLMPLIKELSTDISILVKNPKTL